MKHKLLCLGLLAVAMSCHAATKWEQVSDDAATTVFVDKTSLKKTGKTVKMWVMANFKDPAVNGEGASTKSFKMRKEFDCSKNTHRVLNMVGYAETQGEGAITGQINQTSDYLPVAPDSKDDALAQIACRR